jgi:acyl dehydratase
VGTLMTALLQSSPLLIEKGLLRAYAGITDDWNPLHLDEEFAAKTQLGGIIAHGTLSLNIVLRLFADCIGHKALVLYIRFVKPVRLGDLVTGYARTTETAHDTFEVWVETNHGARVIEGTLVVPQSAAG